MISPSVGGLVALVAGYKFYAAGYWGVFMFFLAAILFLLTLSNFFIWTLKTVAVVVFKVPYGPLSNLIDIFYYKTLPNSMVEDLSDYGTVIKNRITRPK